MERTKEMIKNEYFQMLAAMGEDEYKIDVLKEEKSKKIQQLRTLNIEYATIKEEVLEAELVTKGDSHEQSASI